MYNQPEEILKLYDLQVKQIQKGRGAYICETDQGFKILKEFGGSKERADFLAEVLQEIGRQGFLVEQVVRTKEESALSEDEFGNKYLLKDYYAGAECSPKSREDMKAALFSLAQFHQALRGLNVLIPDFVKDGAKDMLSVYEKHNRELAKVRNYVRTRKKKNEFEEKFREHYPHFMESAAKVTEMLRAYPRECQAYFLCHGDYNQHNAVRTDSGWQIVNLEYMCYHLQVMDLANFIRKMLEKNAWNPRLGMELLESYQQIRLLSEEELRYLYLALAYPEKFWKVANHYYNSHKAWLSGRSIEKLDKVIEQERAREEFLQNLFSVVL